MDSALVPCSTATLTFSSGLLSTMDHSTTNSITSVLPVSSSVIDNKESDNLRLDAINHPSNINIPYNGQPTAILRCNTMPFDVRVLDLSSSVMVGRAVARFKPSSKNAIFDCKVLSRNHALLWYENEKVSCFLFVSLFFSSPPCYYHQSVHSGDFYVLLLLS